MNRLWAVVTDASGNILGDGPVDLTGATITRLLDGAGSVKVTIPGNDPRARSLLLALRRVNVYQQMGSAAPRLVASGIITNRGKNEKPSGRTLDIDGVDLLQELKNTNTLLARAYDNVALATVVSSLAALSGWTAATETSSLIIAARYDGASVLGALQTLVKNNGLHLRLGASGRLVEAGAFGQSTGLTLTNIDSATADDDGMAVIESFSMVEQSEKIFNWLLPIGSGEGEAAVTLQRSTRSFVQSAVGADGRTIYYVSDADSIAAYGMIQKTGQYKDIAPLSNSTASKVDAANTLADAAYADLYRNSQPQVTYACTLRKCAITLRPGDRVRVMYNPPRRDDGTEFDDRVDDEFYITKVTERLTPDASVVSLEISNLNKRRQDAGSTLMEAVERIEQRNYKPSRIQQTLVFHYKDHYDVFSNSTSIWEIPITTDISEIINVKLRVRLILASATLAFDLTGGTFWAWFQFQRSLRYAKCTIDIGYMNQPTYGPIIERNLVTAAGDYSIGYYNEFDVTSDFINSAGGLYNTHMVKFTGVVESLGVTDFIRVPGITPIRLVPPTPQNYATGDVAADLIITAIVQSIAPA